MAKTAPHYEQYVHQFENRFILAKVVRGRYYARMLPEYRVLYGEDMMGGTLARIAAVAYSYPTRDDALSAAARYY